MSEEDRRRFAAIGGYRQFDKNSPNRFSKPVPDIDITWPLDEGVQLRVTREPCGTYIIEDVDSDRQLTLSWKRDGTDWSRLLFDGHDIETEEYMAYVGLMDEVVELLGDKGVGTVTLERNVW